MPYIKKCLDSILQQTFKDFFVVVVDDLSTDCSDKFCEAYERIYPDKLKLLRLDKKGYAGGARNAGIKYSKVESEYILFVDSDDWLIDSTALNRVFDQLKKCNFPDMLLYKYKWSNNTFPIQEKVFNKDSDFLLSSGYNSIHSHIIKTEKQPYFLEGTNFAEDIYAWLIALNTVKTISQCDDVIYVYNAGNINSTVRSNVKLGRQDIHKQLFIDAIYKQYAEIKNEHLKKSIINLTKKLDYSKYIQLYDKHQTLCKQNKLKICIISAANDNLKFQYTYTNKNKQQYCKIHGYEFQFIKLEEDYKSSYHSRKHILLDKIESKKYDWIMWMDADAWFNNLKISLDMIIENYANDETALIVARDHGVIYNSKTWHDCYINSGILLFKSNDVSKHIINLWNSPSVDAKEWMSNYTVLNDQPYLSILTLWDEYVKQHTKIVQPEVLNAFARFGINKDTFIYHVPGDKKIKNRNWYEQTFMSLFNKSISMQKNK